MLNRNSPIPLGKIVQKNNDVMALGVLTLADKQKQFDTCIPMTSAVNTCWHVL